ncbi:MAG: hypothetical protein KDJ25_00405 [Rhodoblastus sp.]|nr:hypothetical protein [Rhodoblastus sp.]
MNHPPGGRIDEHDSAEPPRDGLLRAIRRALDTIDEETAALSGGAHVDHGEFRHRKDLCLLELSRRAPAFVRPSRDSEVIAALHDLKDAIIRNQKTLRCHVNAARQVSAIIMKAITEEESDRTYSAAASRRGAFY